MATIPLRVVEAALALAVVASCGGGGGGDPSGAPPSSSPPPAAPADVVVHLGPAIDADGEGSVAVDLPAGSGRRVIIELDGAARVVEVAIGGGAKGALDGAASASFLRPRPITAPRVTLAIDGDAPAHVVVFARGAPPPSARRERSLVWTEPRVVDDKSIVGLARVMAAAGDDHHGGRMLDAWFRRFATTAHSERAAPAAFADEIATKQGADPSKWNLDELPFVVTAVHDRIDLFMQGGCGETRVSFASTHPVYAPMHLIFLFRQVPAPDDVAPDGTNHCLGTARRWARLASLDGDAFASAAKKLLDATFVHDRFLLAESVELTVSPWEWRQWKPVSPDVLDNPPLFQTIDTESLNVAGARRDDFLAFVAANAADLDARRVQLPDHFRAPSARVPPSAPREMLSLDGLAAGVAATYPDLRRHIEIIGCPTCHTENAQFVQTTPQRTFSPFYDKELTARAARLDKLNAGDDVPPPPFGPLQDP
jgi:hypothetical protein